MEEPTELLKAFEATDKYVDLSSSVGINVSDDGSIIDIIPDKAADRAGVGPGVKIIAVNSRRFSPDLLRRAVAATKKGQPMELLIQ